MTYRKLLVDNAVCSRRFHITYDDQTPAMKQVELRCPHCEHVIFAETNHPAAKIAREENLVKTAELSDHLVLECDFEDKFSQKTVTNFPTEKLYR